MILAQHHFQDTPHCMRWLKPFPRLDFAVHVGKAVGLVFLPQKIVPLHVIVSPKFLFGVVSLGIPGASKSTASTSASMAIRAHSVLQPPSWLTLASSFLLSSTNLLNPASREYRSVSIIQMPTFTASGSESVALPP